MKRAPVKDVLRPLYERADRDLPKNFSIVIANWRKAAQEKLDAEDSHTIALCQKHGVLEKLATLTPRPRINFVVYHGVLAPHARWRSRVMADGAPPLTVPSTSTIPEGSARFSRRWRCRPREPTVPRPTSRRSPPAVPSPPCLPDHARGWFLGPDFAAVCHRAAPNTL